MIGHLPVAFAEAGTDPSVFGLGTYQLDELLLLRERRKSDRETEDVGLADSNYKAALVMLGQVALSLGGVDIGRQVFCIQFRRVIVFVLQPDT